MFRCVKPFLTVSFKFVYLTQPSYDNLTEDNETLGKGQNYENHNVENQKELRKLRRQSEHRNGLFS